MGRQTRARLRGFTLLELLLATSVLASMSVLMGTMLLHARSWREGGDRLQDALALPRASDLLQRQWSQRRVLTDSSAGYALVDGRLQFICSAPLLDPQWPLVRVSYLIEPTLNTRPDGIARWHLVYEEQPITDVISGASQVLPIHADGLGIDRSRLVLLESCTELRLEWFGRGAEDAVDAISHWNEVNQEEQVQPAASALQLVGSYQGEPFSCVLAIEASRSSSF